MKISRSHVLPLLVLSTLPLWLSPAAADDRQDQPLPFDPKVVTGRLDNGLTYYVRQNPKPKDRLDLRLAVKAGSILEADDQQGLAHFLEHMAFNGTENFARQQLVDYLESIGMRFGPELNAYTSFDQTVYRLQVPTRGTNTQANAQTDAVEQGFRILRDWAGGIRNRDDEIQKERGVVIEEWRLGRGAMQRIRDRHYPVLFHGSLYAERLPIGRKEVLESFPPDRLRAFYRDWYRPELMAVIAVGDMEPPAMLDIIRRQFGAIQKPAAPRERVGHPVPGHAETLVSIATDKEAAESSVSICFKRHARTILTAADYRRDLVDELTLSMLNERIDELQRKADPPFLGASAGNWRLGLTTEAFILVAQVKDNGFQRGLEAVLTEAQRARRHGFVEAELARIKIQDLARVEKAFNERDTTESAAFAGDYVSSFVLGDVSPGIEAEWELHRRLLPGIGLQEVNQVAANWLSNSNRVILVSGPDKAGITMPGTNELLAVLATVEKANLKPYEDDVGAGSLIEKEPTPGSVTNRHEMADLGIKIWNLSNGVTVLIKPTTFKKDQVVFTAFSPGGSSLAADADFIPISSAEAILADSGWGRYSETQLRKMLAGKVVSVLPFISELRQGVSGSTRPEDLETAFQLLYQAFTAPRRDAEAFAAYRERMRNHLVNRLAKPEEVFTDEIQLTLYSNHLRRRPWTVDTLKQLDLDRSIALYRQRFQSADRLIVILVGNLDLAKTEPLVERYLAGLPRSGSSPTWKDHGIRPVSGKVDRTVLKGQDPRSRVALMLSGDLEWTVAERHRFRSMLDVLNIRLRERIREEIGGTYSIWAGSSADRYPVCAYQVRIGFGCSPDQVDKLIQAVHAELEQLKTKPVDELYLTKIKQTQLREREVALEQNEFWLGALDSCLWNGDNMRSVILELPQRVEALKLDDIQKAAAKYLSTTNVATFILKPETEEKKP